MKGQGGGEINRMEGDKSMCVFVCNILCKTNNNNDNSNNNNDSNNSDNNSHLTI